MLCSAGGRRWKTGPHTLCGSSTAAASHRFHWSVLYIHRFHWSVLYILLQNNSLGFSLSWHLTKGGVGGGGEVKVGGGGGRGSSCVGNTSTVWSASPFVLSYVTIKVLYIYTFCVSKLSIMNILLLQLMLEVSFESRVYSKNKKQSSMDVQCLEICCFFSLLRLKRRNAGAYLLLQTLWNALTLYTCNILDIIYCIK